jgi:5-methylcytosine-specific restriction endonuclease McrA
MSEPGCHIPAAWCEIDHLIPDTDGGPTNLDNLAIWCSHHHHEKHRPGVNVHGNANNLRIQLPDGTTIHCPTPETRKPAAA